MLSFMVQQGVLQTTPQGRLLPWLGPALRGATAATLKERVCLQPPVERATRWRYCTGCSYQNDCAYGVTYEPDPPGQTQFSGRDHASRAVVLAPEIIPRHNRWDGRLGFELLLTGQAAVNYRQELISSLAAAGENRGLGCEGERFELLDLSPPITGQLPASSLPPVPDASRGVVDRLSVRLNSPLFLRTSGPDQPRSSVEAPEFADLFRACLRSLSSLFALYAEPLNADFAALKFAAQQVRCEQQSYRPFRQPRHSNRTQQRYELRGVVGSAVFRNVPWSLIPWMYWGGRFRVGQHRVCGAGGWTLEMGWATSGEPVEGQWMRDARTRTMST